LRPPGTRRTLPHSLNRDGRANPQEESMCKMLCAAILVVAGTFGAFAQIAGDLSPARTVSPDAIKNLAPTGTLRAAINVSGSRFIMAGRLDARA